MLEVTLGEKGQITLPKAIRDQYHLAKGDRIRMIDLGNGTMELILLKHASELPPPVISTDKRATSGEMKKAVQKAAVDRYKRGGRH